MAKFWEEHKILGLKQDVEMRDEDYAQQPDDAEPEDLNLEDEMNLDEGCDDEDVNMDDQVWSYSLV